MSNISKELQELILKRVETIPCDAQLLTASGEVINKTQLMESIKNLDKIGTDFIEMELFYIKTKAKIGCFQ